MEPHASRPEPLADVATVAGSVAEAVRGADVVVTMLFDADSVAASMEQARGELGDDTVWLQQSTVGVEGSERLAALAADLGVTYVDAPVLGTRKPAEDGALVVLASGPADGRARIDPVLEAIGSRTIWVGEAGGGSRLKLAANAWVFTVVEGIAESLTLTRGLGLDPALFLEAVQGGALDAPYVQLKGKAMLAGSFDPAFALDGRAQGRRPDPRRRRRRRRRPRRPPGRPRALPARRRRRPRRQGHGRDLPRALSPARWSRCPLVEGRGRAALADARSSTHGR